MKQTGIAIIIIGLLITIFTSFTLFTKEKVIDIGKIEITRDKPHHLNWPPFVGVVVIVIGGVVLGQSYRK